MASVIVESRAIPHVQTRAPHLRGWVFCDEKEVLLRFNPLESFQTGEDIRVDIKVARRLAEAITEACDQFEEEFARWEFRYVEPGVQPSPPAAGEGKDGAQG